MSHLGSIATVLLLLGSVIVILFSVMYSVSVARMLREVGSGKQRQELGISLLFYFGVAIFAISETIRSLEGKANLGFPAATPDYLGLVAVLVFALALYARLETARERYDIMSSLAKVQEKLDKQEERTPGKKRKKR